MRRLLRIVLITLCFVALFVAGTAAGGVDLKRVILKPGRCMTIAKVRVCAAKAKTKTVTKTDTETETNTVTDTRTVTDTQTVTAPPVTVTTTVYTTPTAQIAFSDGTYRVGSEIVAGTYKSTATASDCYWERLSGFGGTLDQIIANHFGISPTIVTISP